MFDLYALKRSHDQGHIYSYRIHFVLKKSETATNPDLRPGVLHISTSMPALMSQMASSERRNERACNSTAVQEIERKRGAS